MNIENLHRIGFSLILLKPKRKQPLDDKWSKKPKSKISDILDGLDQGCNLGFRPGITSKTPDGYFVHGIDLDIRMAEDRDEAVANLERLFTRTFLKSCARVKSGSGGESRHFYFKMKRPMRAKTIAHSTEKFFDESKNAWRWRWEIEVFGEGKQLVLPPSIHPDTGKEYVWMNGADDMPVLDEKILDAILDELTRPISEFSEEDLSPIGLGYEDAEKILDKLDFERWFVERDGWRNVGMALHHEFNGSKAAYRLWSQYSKKSKNFDADEQRYQWGTFGRNDRVRPFRMASLIKEASEAEIRDAFAPDESDAEEIREIIRNESKKYKPKKGSTSIGVTKGKNRGYRIKQPAHLLTVPGILGEMVDLFNVSCPRPQPQFAVQTALAIGSVILGRNWRTTANNYSSLFFLTLGKTASGKEHGLKMCDSVLMQSELDLVGPTRYTSDAGLMSALEIRPKHISLADEFSRYLRSARSSGDANQSNAQSALMEVWGRLDGSHRDKGYSSRGMTKQQSEEMSNRHIKRPALTVFGVATPEDFYSAVGNDDVSNGFLNRFLIVETEVPRLSMQTSIKPIEISDEFRRWARDNAYPMIEGDEDIMDAINRASAVEPSDPVVIGFSRAANDMLEEIDAYCLTKMDTLDGAGLDGLYGRVREIVMRLSLIVCRSCGDDRIDSNHIKWARDYVYYHTSKLEGKTIDDMGASDNQRIVNSVYKIIQSNSDDDDLMGATPRELVMNCRPFRNLDTRAREEIIKLLASDFGVVIRNISRKGSRKPSRLFTTRDEI